MIKYYIVSDSDGIHLVSPNCLDVWLPCSILGIISYNSDFDLELEDLVHLSDLFNSCFKHDKR